MDIIFCSYTEQSVENAQTAISNANENPISETALNIKEVAYLTKNSALLGKLTRIISLAKVRTYTVVFEHFEPYQKNRDILKLLQARKVDFTFLDFPELKKGSSLNSIIQYLDYTESRRTTKIKDSLKKRKASGKKQGLANLPKNKVKQITINATRKKQQNILISDENIKLRMYVRKLRDVDCFTYSKIAEILNIEGFKTPRGANFTGKAVERVYKLAKKYLLKSEASNSALEISLSKTRKNAELELAAANLRDRNLGLKTKKEFKISGIENRLNFNDHIDLKFLNKDLNASSSITIKILDNDKNLIHSKEFEGKEEICNIRINLMETDVVMLPGLHYLQIFDNNREFAGRTFSFFFYKEALSK